MAGLSNSAIATGNAYQIIKGVPVNNNANLTPAIAVLAEINHANQNAGTTPIQITSLQQVGAKYGYGSPMYMAAANLFPSNGGGVTGIPVWAFPVLEAGGAAAQTASITVTGTATANVTHTVIVAGRKFVGPQSYNVNIATGDTATAIATKIKNVINAVLGSPVGGTSTTTVITATSKWYGLSAKDLTISVDTNGAAGGVSYAVAYPIAGTGTPDIADTLALMNGIGWFPIGINGWNLTNDTINAALIAFNGNAKTNTGQWNNLVFKPTIWLTGNVIDSTTSSADTAITDALLDDMTIATCSLPKCLGFPIEAAAAYAVNFANVCDATPNIDIQKQALVNTPLASGTPTQNSDYNLRNALVLMGMSTCELVKGVYYPQDFVTTYHPVGETPAVFRYPRSLNIDFNVKFKFANLMKVTVEGKQIANDSDLVNATNVVKPKDVKSGLVTLANDLVSQGFCTLAPFMIASIQVAVNGTNPDRFDIAFSYDRSGVVRIINTEATAYAQL